MPHGPNPNPDPNPNPNPNPNQGSVARTLKRREGGLDEVLTTPLQPWLGLGSGLGLGLGLGLAGLSTSSTRYLVRVRVRVRVGVRVRVRVRVSGAKGRRARTVAAHGGAGEWDVRGQHVVTAVAVPVQRRVRQLLAW